MSNPIFNKNISKSCDYCIFSKKITGMEYILCDFKGPVSKSDFCRRYKYDPIKREPLKTAELPRYSKNDFEL